jgi:hypothetical protein
MSKRGRGILRGCPGLRLSEEEIQPVRLDVVWVGTDGRCADLGRHLQ